jgi:hypothetical protein
LYIAFNSVQAREAVIKGLKRTEPVQRKRGFGCDYSWSTSQKSIEAVTDM